MSDPAAAPPPRIRPAGPFDLAVMAALHAACFDEPWDAPAMAAVLAGPGSFALLAVAGDEPIGFLLGRIAGGEAEILSIGVPAARRRGGAGGLLLRAALARAVAAGAARVFLEVAEDNAAARALYLRHGFAQVGRRPAYYRRDPTRAAAALVLACRLAAAG